MRTEGHAVESTCRVLREQGWRVAARTYRTWKSPTRVIAARTHSDAMVIDAIHAVCTTTGPDGHVKARPESLYGRGKMTALLRRPGQPDVAGCTVNRAMKTLGMKGVRRAKGVRTPIPRKADARAGDLLRRDFTRGRAQPGLGGRLHRRADQGPPGVRRLHPRRVLPTDRGLAPDDQQGHRPGPDPAADSAICVGPRPTRPPGHPRRAGPSQRHPAASTPPSGSPNTLPWKASPPRSAPSTTPGQRVHGRRDRPVQDRVHPHHHRPRRALPHHRRHRVRHRRLRRLVQTRAGCTGPRNGPTRRVRASPLRRSTKSCNPYESGRKPGTLHESLNTCPIPCRASPIRNHRVVVPGRPAPFALVGCAFPRVVAGRSWIIDAAISTWPGWRTVAYLDHVVGRRLKPGSSVASHRCDQGADGGDCSRSGWLASRRRPNAKAGALTRGPLSNAGQHDDAATQSVNVTAPACVR